MRCGCGSDSVAALRLLSLVVLGHLSVEYLEFDAGPITVLFGKNNVGKTNILEAVLSAFTRDAVRGGNEPELPQAAFYVELDRGVVFDDQAAAVCGSDSPPTRLTFVGSHDEVGQVNGPPQV